MRRLWHGVPDEFEKQLRERAIRRKRQDDVRKHLAAQTEPVHPEERSYSPEAMLESSLELYDAVKRHIPSPFPGKATLLLSSMRASNVIADGSFWRDHVDDLEYHVLDGSHKDIFEARIVETARLVTSALEVANEPLAG